jgi:hypothetical protein
VPLYCYGSTVWIGLHHRLSSSPARLDQFRGIKLVVAVTNMEKTDWHDKISVSGVPAGMSVSLSVGGVGVGIVVGMAVSHTSWFCVPLGMSVIAQWAAWCWRGQ